MVQRAHNEHLLFHFAGLKVFGLGLSRVFRQSQKRNSPTFACRGFRKVRPTRYLGKYYGFPVGKPIGQGRWTFCANFG